MTPDLYKSLMSTTVHLALEHGGDLNAVMHLNRALEQMQPEKPEAHLEAIVQANANHIATALASVAEIMHEESGPRKRISGGSQPEHTLDIKFMRLAEEFLVDQQQYSHWHIPALERLQTSLEAIDSQARSLPEAPAGKWQTASGRYQQWEDSKDDHALDQMERDLTRQRIQREIPKLAQTLSEGTGRFTTF